MRFKLISSSAKYSASMGPPGPTANKERANPSSEKVITTMSSSLDSLTREASVHDFIRVTGRLNEADGRGVKVNRRWSKRCDVIHSPEKILQDRRARTAHCAEVRLIAADYSARPSPILIEHCNGKGRRRGSTLLTRSYRRSDPVRRGVERTPVRDIRVGIVIRLIVASRMTNPQL